jgi:hypothetical protein
MSLRTTFCHDTKMATIVAHGDVLPSEIRDHVHYLDALGAIGYHKLLDVRRLHSHLPLAGTRAFADIVGQLRDLDATGPIAILLGGNCQFEAAVQQFIEAVDPGGRSRFSGRKRRPAVGWSDAHSRSPGTGSAGAYTQNG